MIVVTRLNGLPFALNPDLVERAEATPDTVLTLVDGTKYVITETIAVFIERVREYRASILARAHSLEVDELPSEPTRRLVPVPAVED